MMLSYLTSMFYSLFLSDKIYAGVVVDDIDAGGMSKEDLSSALRKKFNTNYENKVILVKAKNTIESVNYNKLKAKFDID